MSSLSRRAMVICAIAPITVAALVGNAGGASIPCGEHDLRADMSVIHGSGGAGHIEYRLTVRNRDEVRCVVDERPGLKLIGARGEHLPTRVRDQGPRGGVVVIRPGQAVSAKLRFSPDIPGPGEPAHGPCQPPAHRVQVALSNSITMLAPVEPPTSVCEHGTIEEGDLR